MNRILYILWLWFLWTCCGSTFATTYPTTSYTLSSDGKTLTQWTGTEADIDLSSDPAFLNVTTIGTEAFRYLTSIQSITFPNGLTTIGARSFANCTNLASITLPASTRSLEKYAFYDCQSLRTVICHAFSRPTLGTDVFKKTPQSEATLYVKPRRQYEYMNDEADNVITEWGSFGTITALTWPKSYELSENGRTLIYWYGTETNIDMIADPELANVRVIGDNAFYGDEQLKSIVFPNKLRSVGYRAFFYCTSLLSVVIPESVEKLDAKAFSTCRALKSVSFNNPNTTLGIRCFNGCNVLTNIQLPANLTTLPDSLFNSCRGLVSINIPYKVKTIGKDAFSNCQSLTSITIPNCVTSIGDNAFYYCKNLSVFTSLPVTPPTLGNNVFKDVPLSSATLHVRRRCAGAYNDGDESEPSVWKEFGNFAKDATDGTRYILSDDGKTLIYWLSEESEIDMTSEQELAAVTIIGNRAFNNMLNITQLVLPENLTMIEERGMSWCENLSNLLIPESVTNIGPNAFMGCYALKSINLPSKLTTISDGMFTSCKALENVWVQDKVTSIGKRAFNNCQSLKSIILPQSVRNIGEEAFNNCTSLSVIQIPDQVTSLGQQAFKGCANLISFSLPSAIKTLPRGVFEDCQKLCHVDLPPSLTTIGNRLFENCDSLRYIEIPRTVTSIEDYAFFGCDSLKQVIFQNIHSEDLPPTLTSIGEYAFSSCKALECIELPSSVTSIGKLAFRWCSSLKDFACHCTTPPTLGDQVFLRVPQSEATLYVPESSLSDYANADQWNAFGTRKALVVEWEKTESLTTNEVVNKIYDGMVMMKGSTAQGMRPFKISKYEVTQDIWKAVMNATPASTQGSDLPVDKVSWDDCQTFLGNLNALSDLTFRLPTEEEWEYAAKGGALEQPTSFAGSNDIDAVAWYAGNADGQIHLVGSKQENETSLYDMTGNVEEWTQTEASSRYVAKGGYYSTSENNAALTARNTYTPSTRRAGLGLRLVLDAPTVVTDPKVLVIITNNNVETAYYLRKLPKITIDGNDLVVIASNATVRFPMDQVKKLTYKQTDPIPTQVERDAPWRMTNEAVFFNDLPENSIVSVYSTDGRRVGSYPATSGSYALSLNAFPTGIYIINVNGLTFKIYKR